MLPCFLVLGFFVVIGCLAQVLHGNIFSVGEDRTHQSPVVQEGVCSKGHQPLRWTFEGEQLMLAQE